MFRTLVLFLILLASPVGAEDYDDRMTPCLATIEYLGEDLFDRPDWVVMETIENPAGATADWTILIGFTDEGSEVDKSFVDLPDNLAQVYYNDTWQPQTDFEDGLCPP